jgi:hypothetical protein
MQIDHLVVGDRVQFDGGMLRRVFGLDGLQHALLPQRHGLASFLRFRER